MLISFLCPRLVQESTQDFAQVQRLDLSEKPSSSERFSRSLVVGSGVLSWKGDQRDWIPFLQQMRGVSSTGLTVGEVLGEECVSLGSGRYR